MVILTMGLAVVITAMVAEAIDGSGQPILSRCPLLSARLGSVGRLAAYCAPLTHPLRPQIVAVSIHGQ
jgi:hypothetical protein